MRQESIYLAEALFLMRILEKKIQTSGAAVSCDLGRGLQAVSEEGARLPSAASGPGSPGSPGSPAGPGCGRERAEGCAAAPALTKGGDPGCPSLAPPGKGGGGGPAVGGLCWGYLLPGVYFLGMERRQQPRPRAPHLPERCPQHPPSPGVTSPPLPPGDGGGPRAPQTPQRPIPVRRERSHVRGALPAPGGPGWGWGAPVPLAPARSAAPLCWSFPRASPRKRRPSKLLLQQPPAPPALPTAQEDAATRIKF